MNFAKKKQLAVRTLGVGKERIVFVNSRLNEIKEAITKQDIRDLKNNGAIIIKNIKGRKIKKRGNKRKFGKIKKTIKKRKRNYILITRRLRKHISKLKKDQKISKEDYTNIRKKIRNKFFKSKSHLKEYLGGSR